MDKTNLKNKYFYDEIQDQVIVNFVKNDLKKRQEERKNFELSWELNMNFFLGNQYSYISGSGEVAEIEKKYYWENREVYNHIAPIIEARLSKLSKINAVFGVKTRYGEISSNNFEKNVLDNSLKKNNFSDLLMNAAYWSEITGTSFYKISWDNDAGEIIGEDDTGAIKSGDVKISVCSPFEIFPDSNSNENVDDCDSIIAIKSLKAKTVNEKYGTDFTGEDIDLFEIGGSTFLSGISGRSNVSKVTHSKKFDQCLIVERYEKPSAKFPNGKLTIVCENKLLFDGDLPYKTGENEESGFPFIKQVSSKQIGCFWGNSVIERCIPIQRAYNAIKNKKHEFIERLASGVLSVEDGSVDIDNLETEGLAPGKILLYRNGSTPPKFMEANEIPNDLKDEEDRLLEELTKISSVSEIMTSSDVPGNLSSGSALSIIISQDNSRLSLVAENIRSSITKVAKIVLRLLKQFALNPRTCYLTNEKGVTEVVYWTNKNLISDDVFLENENELDENSTNNKETLISLMEKGLFNDEDGKISYTVKNKILSMLGIKDFDFEDDIAKLSRKKATNENLSDTKIDDPLEIDEHKLHIYEHTKYLLKENIDKEKQNELIEHINKHKNFIEKED